MDKIKNFWNERRGLFILIVVLLIAVQALMILYPIWVMYITVAGTTIVLVWLVFDSILFSRKRKRQSALDARIAAKEGIEDRRREWLEWTEELSRARIDRYELPFYLLVGEPQSGKSIMLKNSGLHFPLGQSKLSGPGGTRGCDWWFTEEAVVLDLAGRLFTHESGSSDASEWEAFLELLAAYRPLSPANGVLLVIPCDSLLEDSAEESESKAASIRESLMTLVSKLEAKLPIYLVLTKADKLFGFAESVHRMDSEQRSQMFGWSRPGDEFEEAFDLHEFQNAFKQIKNRAHLLRASSMSSTSIPDALPEVDRLFAFPEELGTLEVPLVDYMRRIFTDTSVSDRLFFRGMYLTSGLQQGKPIAQACAALMGSTSEKDSRDLEGLFTKQRAYFIRDFIQARVFKERGLVRPTSERVNRSRKNAMLGYGTAAAMAVAGAIWMGYSTISSASPSEIVDYKNALNSAQAYLELAPEERGLAGLLETLDWVERAIDTDELSAIDRAGNNNIKDFEALHADLCRADLSRLVRVAAEESFERDSQIAYQDCTYAYLEELAHTLDYLLGSMPVASGETSKALGDFSLADADDREALIGLLSRYPNPDAFFWGSSAERGEGAQARPSTLEQVILTHLSRAGEGEAFAPSRGQRPGAALERAGANIAALYERFLSSAAFGGGLALEADETTNLERVVMLFRLGNAIQGTATQLANPASAVAQLGAAAPPVCDLISSSNAQLQRSLRDLDAFHAGFTTVSEAGFDEELHAAAELLGRILPASGNQLPGRWKDLERYARFLFDSGGEKQPFRNWQRTPRGARSLGQKPKPPAMPPIARRAFKATGPQAGASGSPGQRAAESYGDLILPELDGIHAALGLDETAIARQIADCRKDVVQSSSEANPVALMEFISAKNKVNASLDSEAERAAEKSLLRSQIAGVKDRYSGLYRASLQSDAELGRRLELSAADQNNKAQFGLCLPVMEHLLAMHALLSGVDPEQQDFAQLFKDLDACISARLDDLGSAMGAASPLECAQLETDGLAETLAAISDGGRFDDQVQAIAQGFFAKRRAGLLEGWQGKTAEASGQMLAELLQHLRIESGLLERGTLAQGLRESRNAWLSGEVKPVLTERIAGFDQSQRAHWEQRAAVLPSAAPNSALMELARAVRSRLDPRELRADFARHGSAGYDFGLLLRNFEKIQVVLSEEPNGAQAFFPEISALLDGGPGGPLSAAESIELVLELLDAAVVDELRAWTRNLSGSQVTAKLLSDAHQGSGRVLARLDLGQAARTGDGARYFVRATLLAFQAALESALSERYIEDFHGILSTHAQLLRSPIFLKESSADLSQFGMDEMHALLHAIHKLRADFGRNGNQDTQNPNRLSPLGSGSGPANWDEFLHALGLYFGADGARELGNKRISFSIAPGAGSFWKDYGRLNKETLGYWWPFGKQQAMTVGPSSKEVAVDWELDVNRTLYMAWNDSVEAPRGDAGNSLELEGPFAPLVLAWHYGVRDASDPRKVQLSVPVAGGEIPVIMTLPLGFPLLPEEPLPALPPN